MAIRYKDKNGKWTIGSHAVQTKIIDLASNFESDNVEGALRELAEKSTGDLTDLKSTVQTNSKLLGSLNSDMIQVQEDIEWLKVNGGGGGGTAVPTIKSDFENTAVDKGVDVIVPLFFSSPNKGSGTAYILVNNIEVDTTGVSQGNNNVRIKAQYLTATENKVGIYVKDRAGIVTNQLSWAIISGGIELTTTFDYEADYGITDTIKIPYTIDTGITNSEISLYMTIDGKEKKYTSLNGYNYIEVVASELGLGTHAIKMWATVDKYVSKTLSFNLVIVSTDKLYLSSTFESGSSYDYGTPVAINYRLSKISTEEYKVYIKVDGNIIKTQTVTIGSYYWTTSNLSVGPHTITIQAISLDYSEDVSITLDINIQQSEYMPVEDYTLGLICDLNAHGKSNQDDNVEIWKDASGNGHDGKLVNFNFSTNGFVDNTLVCDNDAYVVIPWSPWEKNATTGSTIDIIYKPINSGIEECRVIDYTQIIDDLSTNEIKPFKGLFADTRQSIVSSSASGSSSGKITLDDDRDEIHLTWVLDRENKFMKVFIDGVLSRIMYLSDSGSGVNTKYEDFSLNEHIYLNSTKGLNCGTNDIKRFRVWDHALTSDQVLKNHIASIKDLEKQKELYNFNYNNNTLPKMYLTGDTTNMTSKQTVPMKIEYVSPNEEKYGASFNTGIQNNQVRIQGTSSLQYVRHNYTIFLKDEYGVDMYYNPYGKGSVADYVFCLKADYVESSHANNTGMAKFINDCVYSTKLPTQLANENCRSTINGFPIEVYMNGEYLGVYNFNHDRYSVQSYGYDYNKYPNMLVYEINSNSNTSAGAFYRYGDNVESSANVTELEYYKRDFNLIYGNRTEDSDSYSEIKSLVEWVSVAEQDLFRETISERFNKEYLFRYFLVVLMIGGVDSLGKNLKITTFDGKIWYPTFYDLDTILGIDNSGYLTIEPDVEIESGSFNTSNSNLWSKVWNYFNNELKEEWKKMRQSRFTLNNLMKYIYEEQISKIPAKLYNDDAQVKYLDFGSLYTYCCHGNKEHLITRWLRERIAYVDSMLGYFTSQEDQVTIRMNKTGYVEFSVTPYIPLYFSVKWSNATDGVQTFKLKRGETKTFYYNSTTSTDQEVIIYHAQYIKKLENLSNLNPSSCILANATKLTDVEIHSSKLYNVNVTNNKFLRRLDLRDCEMLGTVTATGSSLDITKCKYLRYVDVYNTALTDIQLNTSGGSLIEIYYPKTIQSLRLIKQRLLETVGLPYGEQGCEIPTSLYTINIEECPAIKKLNTSEDDSINNSFASMVYCNNLTLRNSLDLTELNFRGFYRLKSVILENMYNLENLGFNDLLPVGEASTLKYMGISNCSKLNELTFNCSSSDYEITLADDAILNFGKAASLKTITSNCVLKGIKTLIVPTGLESMFFTNEYGTGYSSIKNIWSSTVCSVDTAGATPIATHIDSTFEGIDFAGMHLKNIDLGALVNIPKAINFSLSPTTVNPNFNKNRDGDKYPYLQPIGTLDLSNYTESLAKFFDGVNLDKLQIVCTKALPQTDLSYCFYNSSFSNIESISRLLSKVSNINNLDYCFYQTTIDSLDILSEINMAANSTMNYTFAECPNITNISSITIPRSVVSVTGLFSKCPITNVSNFTVNVSGSISGIFEGCNKLTTINGFQIANVTSVANTFNGCSKLNALSNFSLPETCSDISNLFHGCYELVELTGLTFGDTISAADNWYPPYLTTVSNLTIRTDKAKFTGLETLRTITDTNISGDDLSDLFHGCINLQNPINSNITANVSLTRAFKNCAKLTKLPITVISDTVTNINEMLLGCELITDISGMVFGSGIKQATNWIHANIVIADNITIKSNINFSNKNKLTSCNNLLVTNTVTTLNAFFNNCTTLTTFSFNPNSDCSNVTSLGSMFKGTKMITYDLSTITLTSKCTDINSMFQHCNKVVTIKMPNGMLNTRLTFLYSVFATESNTLVTLENFKIPETVTGMDRLACGISSGFWSKLEFTPGLEIHSQAVIDANRRAVQPRGSLFKWSNIKKISEITFGPNVTDISNLCEYSYLITDFEIPSHITNASSCFKDCRKMTHIRSNWNNSYADEIVATNCYAGCTGITHCDDTDLNVGVYISGLDSVPIEWGGFGFTPELSGVYVFKIPSNDYTLTLSSAYNSASGLLGPGVVSWGDGTTTTMENSHTYSIAGTYIVKMHGYISTNNYSHGSIQETLTEVVKLPYRNATISHMFCNCTNLTRANISNITGSAYYLFVDSSVTEIIANNVTPIGSFSSVFKGCKQLTTITGLNTWNTSQLTDSSHMFNACSQLTTIDISGWDTSNITSIEHMFRNYGLGVGSSKLTTIKGIEQFNTSKITNFSCLFQGQNSLIELDLSRWDASKVTNMSNMFHGCSSLQSINISQWNTSNVREFNYTFDGCRSLTNIIGVENLLAGKTRTSLGMVRTFADCHKLKFNFPNGKPNWFFTNTQTWTQTFNGCGKDIVIDENDEYILDLRDCGTMHSNNFLSTFQNTSFTKLYIDVNTKYGNSNDHRATFAGMKRLKELYMSGQWGSDCRNIFDGCINLEKLDLSDLTIIYATSLNNLLSSCKKLSQLIIHDDLQIPRATDLNSVFKNLSNLSLDQKLNFINKVNVSNVTNVDSLFDNSLMDGEINIDLSTLNFNNANISAYAFLANNTNLQTITLPNNFTPINSNLMFSGCKKLTSVTNFNIEKSRSFGGNANNSIGCIFNGCTELETIDNFSLNFTNYFNIYKLMLTNDYWVGVLTNLFTSTNSNLKNINFSGQYNLWYDYEGSRHWSAVFANVNTSKFTEQTWQSFINCMPQLNSDQSFTLKMKLEHVPEWVVTALTGKGYTLSK